MHCEGGYRASVAASFLDAAGRTVVAVDDEFDRAARAGLPVDGLLPQRPRRANARDRRRPTRKGAEQPPVPGQARPLSMRFQYKAGRPYRLSSHMS